MKKYLIFLFTLIPIYATSNEGDMVIVEPGSGQKTEQEKKDEMMEMLKKMMVKLDKVDKDLRREMGDLREEMGDLREEMGDLREEMEDFEAKNNTGAIVKEAKETFTTPKLLLIGGIMALGFYGYHYVNKTEKKKKKGKKKIKLKSVK